MPCYPRCYRPPVFLPALYVCMYVLTYCTVVLGMRGFFFLTGAVSSLRCSVYFAVSLCLLPCGRCALYVCTWDVGVTLTMWFPGACLLGMCTSLSPLLAAFRPPGQVGRVCGRSGAGAGGGEGTLADGMLLCLSGLLYVDATGMAWKRPSQREIEGRQADRGCSSRSRSRSSSSSLHACIACIDACVHACNCNLACYLLCCSHVWGRGR